MRVGDEVECTCPRCKLILSHVILYFREDGTIGAVECRTCGLQHPFLSHRKGRIRRTHPSGKTLRALLEGGDYEQRFSRLDRERLIPYTSDGSYSVNDAILHRQFGVGFVLRVGTGRIEVLFEDGIKVLVAGGAPEPGPGACSSD